MLDLRDLGSCVLQEHHIEPAHSLGQMMPGEVLGSQSNQFFLFWLMHRMNRSPELIGPARFHFDEDEDLSVFRDQIELPHRRSEISGEDAIAFAAQVGFCRRFSFLPNQSPRIKRSHRTTP